MTKRNIKSAVITGPTGCIGTALCKKLIEEGITAYAIVHPNCKRLSGLPKGVNIIECDISNLKKILESIKQADAFFHLAWAQTFGEGRNDMPVQIDNIRYAIDAVDVAAKLNCKVFIGAGSQAECGRVEGLIQEDTPCFPENGYGMAKLCAGEMTRIQCQKYGIDHIWMRVLSIYGPHDGLNTMISSTIVNLLKGQIPCLTKAEQEWDYLYSEDAANGFFCAAISGINEKVYPLGSGKVFPLKEYVIKIKDAINPKLSINFGGREYAKNQVMHLQADISSLKEDTGFEPKWSFEEGIQSTIDWLKKETI